MKKNNLDHLLEIMSQLRDPKKGCPWDIKQTLETIIPHAIEEVYEVAEQIYEKNYEKLKNELGDLLFQIVYLTQITKEKNKFNFNDVVKSISKKMIYRHPHVFSDKKFKSNKDFNIWWENSKKKKQKGILDDIPNTYPSITKSFKIQKKVANFGFDYKNTLEALNKVEEELNELKKEILLNNKKNIKDELGDLIFSTLDLSRKMKLNPENILARANMKFTKRFNTMEQNILKTKKNPKKLSYKEWDKFWRKSKKNK